MPLVRIDVIRGRDPEQLRTLLDTIHDATVAAFDVPETDRYQILTQHGPGDIVALDAGLVTENGPADWSFGDGRAQFLTGAL